MVDPADLFDSLDRRYRGSRAGRDQDPLGLELELADPEAVSVDEGRLARVGREALVHQVGDPLVLRLLQRLLPGPYPSEVGGRRTCVDPDLRCQLVHVVRELRRYEVSLRRLARDVRTAPAPALPLDEGHARAVQAGGLVRGVPGGRAAPDHDQVELLAHAYGPPSRVDCFDRSFPTTPRAEPARSE